MAVASAVTADVFLNHNWEEDFPEDQTGNLDNLKEFIQDNFDICKWIGLAVVSLQGLSILLAMILKALGPHSERYYESDDDSLPDRVPLLKNYVPEQSYVVGDPSYGVKIDTSNMRANSKVENSFWAMQSIRRSVRRLLMHQRHLLYMSTMSLNWSARFSSASAHPVNCFIWYLDLRLVKYWK